MIANKLLFAASVVASVRAAGTDAPVVTTNPPQAQYEATFAPSSKNDIQGQLIFTTTADQVGVNVQVTIDGLPSSGGPFLYHIHQAPVPADGNCTATLAHLDPYNRGEDPPCDSSNPSTCQVGDLAGKHGTMPATSTGFSAVYNDDYIATDPTNPAYIGGKSIVIHFANKTRLACTNLMELSPGTGSSASSGANSGAGSGASSGTSSGTSSAISSTASSSAATVYGTPTNSSSGSGTASPTSTHSPAQFTGAAAIAGVTKGAFAAILGGLAFAL